MGETPTAEMSQDAKLALNLMLASWSIRNVAILVTAKDALTLSPQQVSYTIGPVGADFTSARPKKVLLASLEDENQIYTHVDVIGEDQYILYGDRDIVTGRPNRIFYEATMPNGTFYLYYIPDRQYVLHLSSVKAFLEIPALDAEFDLDEAYLEPIIYGLAVRMAPDFGMVASPDIKEAASNLFDTLLNYAAQDMTVFLDITVRRPRASTIYVIE